MQNKITIFLRPRLKRIPFRYTSISAKQKCEHFKSYVLIYELYIYIYI